MTICTIAKPMGRFPAASAPLVGALRMRRPVKRAGPRADHSRLSTAASIGVRPLISNGVTRIMACDIGRPQQHEYDVSRLPNQRSDHARLVPLADLTRWETIEEDLTDYFKDHADEDKLFKLDGVKPSFAEGRQGFLYDEQDSPVLFQGDSLSQTQARGLIEFLDRVVPREFHDDVTIHCQLVNSQGKNMIHVLSIDTY